MNRAWEYPGDRFCSPDGSAGRGAAGDEVVIGLVQWGLVGCRGTAGGKVVVGLVRWGLVC